VVLDASAPSPFAPKNDEEKPKDEDEAEAKEDSKNDKKEDAEAEVEKTVIDLEGIGARIVPLPVPAGNYQHLSAGNGKLFYLSVDFQSEQAARPDAPKGQQLLLFDMEERENAEVLQSVDGFEIDAKGKKLLVVGPGRSFSIVDAAKDQKAGEGTLDLSGLVTTIDYREEWAQIFHEAWRIERDFFWDPGMGGKDWEAIGKRYEKLLPWVAHRSDLNYLIGELIGELATSHTYVGGGDYPHIPHVGVGLLGVDFIPGEGYWQISKIYPGEDWDKNRVSPLRAPGLEVSEGNYLIAVNGVEVPVADNPYSHFQGMANQEITLLVNDKPSRKGAHEILVKAIGDESGLRYHDWVESNRRKVSEATDGKVGYMHVPNTSVAGLREFDKYLQAQTLKKALIVDERYNAGGMIPDFYTNKLKKRLLNFISPRNGKDMPWPPNTMFGPKVLLVNEFAGSGGDCFPWYFQQEKIGPVIGMRTWGGLVGYSRLIPMLDGGRVTAPEVAFWTPRNGGEWIVENHGVDPDIEIDNRPDLVAKGADPQLEKAIEVITKELAQQKPLPERPPYPRGR
jgi:tricorn protease